VQKEIICGGGQTIRLKQRGEVGTDGRKVGKENLADGHSRNIKF